MTDEFIAAWPFPSLGRMATAEEQAWPLILINSPLCGAVTGAFLYTDQGFASGVFTGAISPASPEPCSVCGASSIDQVSAGPEGT